MKREIVPDPWMFDVTVSVDGRAVQGEVGRFTLLGRVRMKLRALLGKPPLQGWPG